MSAPYTRPHRCPWCDRWKGNVNQVGGPDGPPSDDHTAVGICDECFRPFFFDSNAPGGAVAVPAGQWGGVLSHIPPEVRQRMADHGVQVPTPIRIFRTRDFL